MFGHPRVLVREEPGRPDEPGPGTPRVAGPAVEVTLRSPELPDDRLLQLVSSIVPRLHQVAAGPDLPARFQGGAQGHVDGDRPLEPPGHDRVVVLVGPALEPGPLVPAGGQLLGAQADGGPDVFPVGGPIRFPEKFRVLGHGPDRQPGVVDLEGDGAAVHAVGIVVRGIGAGLGDHLPERADERLFSLDPGVEEVVPGDHVMIAGQVEGVVDEGAVPGPVLGIGGLGGDAGHDRSGLPVGAGLDRYQRSSGHPLNIGIGPRQPRRREPVRPPALGLFQVALVGFLPYGFEQSQCPRAAPGVVGEGRVDGHFIRGPGQVEGPAQGRIGLACRNGGAG